MRFPGRAELHAAWWALRASHRTRALLRTAPLSEVVVPAPPALPPGAGRGMRAALRLRRDSCLVKSLVRQTWDAGQGHPRDLIIGVNAPSQGFEAHAWLEGDMSGPFEELMRHRPPVAG